MKVSRIVFTIASDNSVTVNDTDFAEDLIRVENTDDGLRVTVSVTKPSLEVTDEIEEYP